MKKRKHRKLPTLSLLHEKFEYDPITGVITHKSNGKQAGHVCKQGYRQLRIKRINYKAHRIAFYMFHRHDPGSKVIDHIDGNKDNNSIFNLRACTHRQNVCNTAGARASGKVPKSESGLGRAWA